MKKTAHHFLWIGILATLATSALAETRTISWGAVTTYTDGTPIEAGKTVNYLAYWAADPGLGTLHPIGTSITTNSTTFDPDVQGMTRGATVYFTIKTVLGTSGEASALSPAYPWVVALSTPTPAAPKNIGITGPLSSGTAAMWRLTWLPVTTYSNGTPLEPGRTIRYTAYWTDDPALSVGSLRQLVSSVSATSIDFDPIARQMPVNRPAYLTVQSVLETGDSSALAVGIKWVVANTGPVPPKGGIIKKK